MQCRTECRASWHSGHNFPIQADLVHGCGTTIVAVWWRVPGYPQNGGCHSFHHYILWLWRWLIWKMNCRLKWTVPLIIYGVLYDLRRKLKDMLMCMCHIWLSMWLTEGPQVTATKDALSADSMLPRTGQEADILWQRDSEDSDPEHE